MECPHEPGFVVPAFRCLAPLSDVWEHISLGRVVVDVGMGRLLTPHAAGDEHAIPAANLVVGMSGDRPSNPMIGVAHGESSIKMPLSFAPALPSTQPT